MGLERRHTQLSLAGDGADHEDLFTSRPSLATIRTPYGYLGANIYLSLVHEARSIGPVIRGNFPFAVQSILCREGSGVSANITASTHSTLWRGGP